MTIKQYEAVNSVCDKEKGIFSMGLFIGMISGIIIGIAVGIVLAIIRTG